MIRLITSLALSLTVPDLAERTVPEPSSGFYPYSRLEAGAKETSRSVKAVSLENDRLAVTILPDWGGRIWSAVDKVRGTPFIVGGTRIVPKASAGRAPDLLGGLTCDWGASGGARAVDYLVRTNADGSASCFLFANDYARRMSRQVEIWLGADEPRLEIRTSCQSSEGLPSCVAWGSCATWAAPEAGELTTTPGKRSRFAALWWPDAGVGCLFKTEVARQVTWDASLRTLRTSDGGLSLLPGMTFAMSETWQPLADVRRIATELAANPALECVGGACGANVGRSATELAALELRRGNYDAVHALLAKALAGDANEAMMNYLDGFAAFAEGKTALAKERLSRAALSPAYASAAETVLSRLFIRTHRRTEAKLAAERALRANPDNCEALHVMLILDRNNQAVARRVRERYPLLPGARYEAEGSGIWRLLHGELPEQTYLELMAWYAETGLEEDVRDLAVCMGDTLMAKLWVEDYDAARKLSVAGVMPFRREELSVLQKAVATDGHWKFRYLLAVLSAYFGYDEQADGLLNGCENDPTEPVFYLFRASRRTGAAREADLRRAQELKGESVHAGIAGGRVDRPRP